MGESDPLGSAPPARQWSAWRVVLNFGIVSLVVDLASDGAQSLTGPLLGQLGASALVVGVVTGLGEAFALSFRLISGPWSDRTGRYWTFTIAGYALTAVCVPLLAVTPFVGGTGLVLASALILAERTGKAIRSPAKTVLLANAAGAVGRGRGFAVHKSLDQAGSLLGPLVVSAVIAATTVIWPAFAVLAVPGAVAIGILVWMRTRVPDLSVYEGSRDRAPVAAPPQAGAPEDSVDPGDPSDPADRPAAFKLPRTFYLFAATVGVSTVGLVSFGVISFHLVDAGILPLAAVPLVFAVAMGSAAIGALASGYAYDKLGTGVLFTLPVMIALVPGLTLSAQLGAVIVGAVLWGMATGIQESTVKALVADLVPNGMRGTAYGIFAAFEGAAALAGGALAGALYGQVPVLVATVVALQVAAFALLWATIRRQHRDAGLLA
ncbi:MFS transporter [Cryobacterium algoritolerans]|uniref:MFS transporter n=1 Tax=Cryobacterium algoritolerans TaxID=1259184 RepID=A0A4R8WUY5_9MICO|nr:MFS transporter [Cryobacterium algoritolerans]TFC17635.1 MFS transporter [Cryobacterium algoritolerans]